MAAEACRSKLHAEGSIARVTSFGQAARGALPSESACCFPSLRASPRDLAKLTKNHLEARCERARIHRRMQMKRFVKLLFLVLLALPAIALLVANRHDVVLYLDPFAGPAPEGTQITVRLFVVLGVATMVGVIFGGAVTYLEQGRHRRAARRARREVDSLRAEVARLSLPRAGEKRKSP
jgi:hypothetical protein